MSELEKLRSLVKQQLDTTAEISRLFETTIADYEEELSQLRENDHKRHKLLDVVFNPEIVLHRSDGEQPLVIKEEVLSEGSSNQDQKNPPEHLHITEEQGEHLTNKDGEQLKHLQEPDMTRNPFIGPVKSKDDDNKPQSSQLQSQTQNETRARAEIFGSDVCGRQFTRKSNLKRHTISHAGKKPFGCDICGKRFVTLISLEKHLKIYSYGSDAVA